MPRLSPRLLAQTARRNPLLAKLLPTCRDLDSARNELRWLREHAEHVSTHEFFRRSPLLPSIGWRALLGYYVARRARGEPLQYILGTQPFGELQIRCKPGVLIPRTATEIYVESLCEDVVRLNSYIAEASKSNSTEPKLENWYHRPNRIRVLDVCTGTGCIGLGVYQRLFRNAQASLDAAVEVLGIDRSPDAVRLALENKESNGIHLLHEDQTRMQSRYQDNIHFRTADLLAHSATGGSPTAIPSIYDYLDSQGEDYRYWDILISNPPYVSKRSYDDGTTTRSVRRYEPVSALIPSSDKFKQLHHRFNPPPGDEFYPHLVDLADFVKARLSVFEVSDTDQARNVVQYIRQKFQETSDSNNNNNNNNNNNENNGRQTDPSLIEAWQDQTLDPTHGEDPLGPIRAVAWWRGPWAKWRQATLERDTPEYCKVVFSTTSDVS